MDPVRASRLTAALVLIPALALLAACTSGLERELDEVEQLRLEAAEAGAEWLQTENLLEQAREAIAAGDEQAARGYIDEARFQAEAAILQAERESAMWQNRVIR